MSYLGELRENIRPLAAASLGCGTGLPLMTYTVSVFGPHLLHAFGWSRAQFALVGITQLTTILILPFIGRFTDRIGVWRMALMGTVLVPLCFVGYALQWGNLYYYMACSIAVMALGSMAGPLVYTRLVAENFRQAQGLALTIINCAPAVVAIGAVPLLNWLIVHYGWRTSYLALGVLALVGGGLALALIGRPKQGAMESPEAPFARSPARADYAIILKSRIFWIIVVGIFLCMLQTPLHASQINIMLLDKGVTTQQAASIVSIYAFGTIVGRIACGLSLDRYATPIVAAVSMGVPAIGFLTLGSSLDSFAVIAIAMFIIGLSVGAESDIIAFLVARYFNLRIYSSTFGLVYCAAFLASAIGAASISLTLKLTGSFAPFLFIVAATITSGALLFLLLPASRKLEKVG